MIKLKVFLKCAQFSWSFCAFLTAWGFSGRFRPFLTQIRTFQARGNPASSRLKLQPDHIIYVWSHEKLNWQLILFLYINVLYVNLDGHGGPKIIWKYQSYCAYKKKICSRPCLICAGGVACCIPPAWDRGPKGQAVVRRLSRGWKKTPESDLVSSCQKYMYLHENIWEQTRQDWLCCLQAPCHCALSHNPRDLKIRNNSCRS